MTPSTQPEIAIFGGSFDPPHLSHVFLAAYALSVQSVERVLVVPVYQHAFGKPLSPFEDRVAMCELAFRDLRRTEISRLEQELGGVSRTLRLIEALATRYPRHRLRTLVGSDILAESGRWQDFAQICARAPLLVAMREGSATLPEAHVHGPTLPKISSTEVRRALARGESPSDRVPGAVVDYALAHGLFRAESRP